MKGKLDFWFSIGSTYTYLAVMRIDALAAARGVAVSWRPFSVRTLMVEQNNVPFRDKPIKAAYMWRDIERRAGRYDLPIRLPVPYPLTAWDRINRIAVLAAQEGWCAALATAAYRRWFQQGEEPGLPPALADLLGALGQDAARVIDAAEGPAIEAAYLAATDAARALGIFGAPTFVARDEIFWGDDRLEDAIDWALRAPSR